MTLQGKNKFTQSFIIDDHLQYMINRSIEGSFDEQTYYQNKNDDQRPSIKAINDKGVHTSIQLMLILVLIMVSFGSVLNNIQSPRKHLRYLGTYFNLHLLGKQDLGYYEQGQNIDENDRQYVLLDNIITHLSKLINATNTLQSDGIASFTKSQAEYMLLEVQFKDNSIDIQTFSTLQQALQYFHNLDTQFMRPFILQAAKFRITLPLGSNRILNNFKLVAEYTSHSYLMVDVQLNYQHQTQHNVQLSISALRIIEQILASLLFVIYSFRLLWSRKDPNEIKFRGWLAFLALMSLIILFSSQYAPMAICVQLLPIFEFQNVGKRGQKLDAISFNNHLSFSLKLIAPVFFSGFILLNGFIFYSMLMYPGDYFDSYSLSFFSYIYQMFQVGTYQIFTQLQRYGDFAYLLYALLYFYMFEVGNSLIPALFCIMIQMKITERDVRRYTHELVSQSHCPKCDHTHGHQIQMDIAINSSKLLPLMLKPTKSPKQEQRQYKMVLIQEQDNKQLKLHYGYNVHEHLAGYSRRIQSLTRKLSNKVSSNKHQDWLNQCLIKIQRLSLA